MNKQFNQDFKNKLWEVIAEIEKNSQVEVVVIIKPESESYLDIALWSGACLAFLAFSFFIFYPLVFGDYLLYSCTILAFMLGTSSALFIKPFLALLLPAKRKKRAVEIMARALFQKGGINNTSQRTGILFYHSLLEKSCFILPDKGAENAIPIEEWRNIKLSVQKIFRQTNQPETLLKELQNLIPVFNKYIPPVEGDINELPDNLEIIL